MKTVLVIVLFALNLLVIKSNAQVNSDCLIAYYPFNGNTLDYSGYSNNAINHGAVLSSGYLGSQNSAYELSGNTSMNGSDVFIEVPNIVDGLDRLTISLWVKQNSYCYNQYGESYISFGTLPAMGTVSTSIYYDKNYQVVRFVVMTDSNTYSCSTPYLSSWTGVFQHYAMVYDRGQGKIWAYHNANLVANITGVKGCVKAIGNYGAIGKHWWASGAGNSTRINGVFDEVKVYRCALDSTQIQGVYSSINGLEKTNNALKVYPNPSHDIVNFDLSNLIEHNYSLSIYNSMGQEVRSINGIDGLQVFSLERENLPSGLYYYQMVKSGRIISSGNYIWN